MNDVALKNEASGEYNFSIVNNDELVLVWEGAKKYLEKSCKRSNGRIRPEDIFYDCLNGSHRLWIVFDTGSFDIKGIVVTQKVIYPTGKAMLSLEHITGNNMEDWAFRLQLFFLVSYLILLLLVAIQLIKDPLDYRGETGYF